ncbi:MAG: hypothetical protein ACP5FZ_05460 [Fidelibacterota bacterium]
MHVAAIAKRIVLLILAVGFRLMVAGTPPADSLLSLLSLELSDGSLLQGTIIAEEPDSVVFMTASGLRITLPKSIIASRRTAHGWMVTGEFRRSDPNYTRLLFTPTGHPLGKGVGYMTELLCFFSGNCLRLDRAAEHYGGLFPDSGDSSEGSDGVHCSPVWSGTRGQVFLFWRIPVSGCT